MKKSFFLSVILSSFCLPVFSAAIHDAWDLGGHHFELKIENNKREVFESVTEIARRFHTKDKKARRIHSNRIGGEEKFAEFIESSAATRVLAVLEKKESLLVLYRDSVVVGGCFFIVEDKERVVRMTLAGFDDDILVANSEQNIMARVKAIANLSSKEFFPHAENLIVLLGKGSKNSEQLRALEFSNVEYETQEFPSAHFDAFARKIVKR